jgi:U2 small nuclear ribonucleoprotein B''
MADVSAPPMAAAPISADPSQSLAPAIVAPAPVAAVAPAAPAEPELASETLYIQNLNEKIKIPVLKASLKGLFKSYGEVLDVVAHSNLRMRGQAFVSFENADIAKKALKEVRGFPLYSKPMVSSALYVLWLLLLTCILANIIRADAIRCSCQEVRPREL